MADTAKIKEHMDVISSDRKTVGQVDHLDGSDKIKLTKQSSPDGQHHHFIPVSWVDHVDQHVHLNKSGADITAHWQPGQTVGRASQGSSEPWLLFSATVANASRSQNSVPKNCRRI